MAEWLSEVMTSPNLSLAAFPAAFLFGLLGSFTSCCNLPVLGAIAGYSGTLGNETNRGTFLLIALLFIVGTVAALTALGAIGGFLGQVAGASLGLYWRLFAGFIMVLFGLVSMGLVPFDFASVGIMKNLGSDGRFGPTIYGLAVGGALPLVRSAATRCFRQQWGLQQYRVKRFGEQDC